MSEYKSFKEIFGYITDSKGIKFINIHNQLFEPRFLSEGRWYGLSSCCNVVFWNDYSSIWKKYTAPKKTKKVMMYKPVYEGLNDDKYYSPNGTEWRSHKNYYDGNIKIVGWLSQEVEVECD